ncbi:peptidoglycan D,D-transpeptidase FtsI family protein [Teredinibacter purpureus]|nr:penicillin-binding transpeptidase domain-containing protein [Teredinibacter purpureus]
MSFWRFWVLGGMLIILPCALAWHLANLQVVPSADKGFEFLQSEGEARTLRSEMLSAYRGVITDRNGELLAVSTPVTSIYANPELLDENEFVALASALDIPVSQLRDRVEVYENKQFMYLARHLPPQQADKILEQKFSGVAAETEYRRYYPAGEVAAHVVGFTDLDDHGQEGIELAFDEHLAGAMGYKRVLKDLKGNIVKEKGVLKAPVAGKELRLSLDLRLQYLAYKELKAAVNKQKAKSGSVVLLDVRSGEILAMVNQPSYNPNDRSHLRSEQIRNRAITDVFEPGSTVKPLTVMAALETGRYTPEHVIDTSPGYVMVGKKALLDPKDYGRLSITKIITKSSQVGITKLALDIEPRDIRELFFRAGMGQSTGMGFPGESVGVLPTRDRWLPIETATLAFGYGLNVNAVQLAQAYAMIADKGNFKHASLLRSDDQHVESQVVSKSVAQSVIEMLKTVPRAGGTATRAQIDAYPVAGKTGTSHKIGVDGYAEDRHFALFAGFSPADNPEVVAVIVINEPTDGKYFGGEAAAPVFASIVEGALKILRVPPQADAAYVVGL